MRCGLCGRVASIRCNDRGQGFFRCGGQGQRCKQPARSANGLERATVLGLGLLADDKDLQAAIRYQLTAHWRAEAPARPSHRLAIATLERKLKRILDLCVNEHMDGETYAIEHRRLTTQLQTLQREIEDFERAETIRDEAVDKFDQVAEFLAGFEAQRIWVAATPTERWTLVKNLVDSVCIYPDRLTVQVAGAPPFTVALDEVGLKKGGTTVVSEARCEPARCTISFEVLTSDSVRQTSAFPSANILN